MSNLEWLRLQRFLPPASPLSWWGWVWFAVVCVAVILGGMALLFGMLYLIALARGAA